jgi:Domain of unknown function (DUF4226)
MSAYEELLAAVEYVRDRTGDPNAWQAGLAPSEVAAVITPTTRPEQLEAIVRKIRQQHSDLFGAGTPGAPSTRPPTGLPEAPSDRADGEAAEAMADAEAALAHQNSASSQLDMQVVSAILNAHLKAVEGREALTKLQRETEAAVLTRSDLDTPAGARDFQRFLIGKLKDIRAVVLNASLDDTSKSALMAAWTSLYDASKGGPNDPGDRPLAAAAPVTPAGGTSQQPVDDSGTGSDPLLDSILANDPGPLAGDSSAQGPTAGATAPAMPTTPATPAIPTFGAGPMPGPGTAPGSMAGWGGLPLPGLQDGGRTDPAPRGLDDRTSPGSHDPDSSDRGSSEEPGDAAHDQETSADMRESPLAGPTTVTLPDGDTVTAASPQLAAAIKAAVGGAPIADAFHQQGITIPPPGTPVTSPLDPRQVIPGDVGVFTDRHALALGHEKALLDGQIQHIATVSGPNFLGWEHPPAAIAQAKPDAPTPTRPAATSTTRQ